MLELVLRRRIDRRRDHAAEQADDDEDADRDAARRPGINAVFTKLGLTADTAVHRRVAAVLAYLGDGAT